MKCQAWVDPRKFSKKTKHATDSAAIGLDVMDWDWHSDPKKVGKKNAARIEALRAVAVRCGGPISVTISGDDEYGVEIEYVCDWCLQRTKPIGLPKDVEELENHLQALVNARPGQLGSAIRPRIYSLSINTRGSERSCSGNC